MAKSAGKPSNSEKVIRRDRRVISPSYTRTNYPLVIDRGKGIYLWDVDGKRYMDFTSGIAVANVGHSNPEVVKAIRDQTEKILHNAGTDFYNEPAVTLAEKLWGRQLLPVGPALYRVGLTFSVGLALFPTLIMLIGWILRVVGVRF